MYFRLQQLKQQSRVTRLFGRRWYLGRFTLYFTPVFLRLRIATNWAVQVSTPGIFSSQKPSRQTLGPTQPPISWVPGREFEHSPPTCAEVKNECSYTPTPPTHLYSVYGDTLIIRSSLLTNARTVPSNRPQLYPFQVVDCLLISLDTRL
jgi:hypothetical protein